MVGAGLVALFGGLLGMFSKQGELALRVGYVEDQVEKADALIAKTHTTVVKLETTMVGFGEQLKDIKKGQQDLPERLLALVKGAK